MKYRCAKRDCGCETDYFLEYYSPKESKMVFIPLCEKHQTELGTMIADYLDYRCMMYWDVGTNRSDKDGRTIDG